VKSEGPAMQYDFDLLIDRRHSDSSKWNYYPEDVLPMWTADMDFRAAAPVIDALHRRVEHGVFGYCMESAELRAAIVERLERLYCWHVLPEEIVFQAGVVFGFNRACNAVGSPGDGVLVQPPVYPPMLSAAGRNRMVRNESELVRRPDGSYEIDFSSFEAAITDRTRLFILCNPHNPVGRVFQRGELEKMAEICLRRNVLICSDEIHCDLVFAGAQHAPIASLSPEIHRQTITLFAASKSYNIPGLHCSIAVVPQPELRRRLQVAEPPFFPEVNALGFTATLAAYRDGQEWLQQALAYLETNRNTVVEFVNSELPGIRTHAPEATYLAWLDCRGSGISGNPCKFFLERARIAFSDGSHFGKGGEGFVRLNFACPRPRLLEALRRMKSAVAGL